MQEAKREQVHIQRMKKEDLEEVMTIEQASFSSPWTRNMFLEELKDNHLSCFLVARIDEQIIGYGGFSPGLDGVRIGSLAIHPYFRRREIGEKLLAALLSLAKLRGIKKVALEVRVGNIPAQNLYGKFGFKVIGRHQCYYQDTQEDALLMSLDM